MIELIPFDILCDNCRQRQAAFTLKDDSTRIGDYCGACANVMHGSAVEKARLADFEEKKRAALQELVAKPKPAPVKEAK